MVQVAGFRHTGRFAKELASAPPDVVKAAGDALTLLKANPKAKSLRLHPLTGLGKPSVWKIDVYANRSWQISFEMEGDIAKLCRLAPHKTIDRDPRSGE